MKSLFLAATVVAGLLCSTGTADAQFRRNRVTYTYPSYSYVESYPSYSYSYPSYSYPSYSYYTPSTYGSNEVIVTSGYTPTVQGTTSYYTPTIYGNSYYSTPYY